MRKIMFALLILTTCCQAYPKSTFTLNDSQAIDINGTMYCKSDLTPFSGKLVYHKDRRYYQNGRPHGKWLCFYPNGNLRSIENWKNGQLVGKYVLYEKDGHKIFETTYLNGKDNGDYFMYHKNGKIQVKGHFINGVPTGTWSFYNDKGKLTGRAKY